MMLNLKKLFRLNNGGCQRHFTEYMLSAGYSFRNQFIVKRRRHSHDNSIDLRVLDGFLVI